jgi:pyruvate-formate lyase-activating enzyme
MKRIAVMEPPRYDKMFLFQEECCWDMNTLWRVPGRSLQMASALECDFWESSASPDQFWNRVDSYDEVHMIVTYPLWNEFSWLRQASPEQKRKIRAYVNPPSYTERHERETEIISYPVNFKLHYDPLRISERFYPLFDEALSVVQIASGCQFHCRYCVWPSQSRYVADPVQAADLTDRSKRAYLLCPQITGSHQWIDRFVSARKRHNKFSTDLNAVHSDAFQDDIKRLAGVGLDIAVVGTEAFTDSCLLKLGCPHTMKQTENTIKILGEAEVNGFYEWRSGYGETAEEIRGMADWLVTLAGRLPVSEYRHILSTGPINYWEGTRLPLPEKVIEVDLHGFKVIREKLNERRRMEWREAYSRVRNAGWHVQ